MVMIIMMWGLVKALRQENQYHPQLIQEQYRETFTSQILTEKVVPDTELN
jgi:choline-glycine betaine transporter